MKSKLFVAAVLAASACAAQVPYNLGIAGFTFHRKDLPKALAAMQALDVHYLCVKDFHLPLTASPREIAEFKQKLAAADVKYTAVGPIYMDSEKVARASFEYARKLGVKTIVGVPFEKDAAGTQVESDKMLDVVEKLVREFDIRYAIHNHGPDIPKLFPTAEAAMARIGGRDRRIGLCLDVGHQRRAGLDPVDAIRTYADRIYDVHIKNIVIDPVKNLAMQGPRGELDIPAILTALAEIGYDGNCHIEYERDFDDNALGLAESVGYYRGVMDSIRVAARMKPVPAGANTLTDAEKAEGWTLLWDGTEKLDQWVGVKGGCKAFPEKGWFVKDGCLTMRPVSGITPDRQWFSLPPEDQKLGGGGDIVTVKKYRDFAFRFDFRLTRAANSGVKYFFDETQNRGTCEEYQILEDGHPDSSKGKDGNRKVASLYDIYPARAEKVVKGVGEWNTGMVVSKGDKVEHWLNGVKVLEYVRGNAAFKAAVKASKYADWGDGKDWGELPEGRLLLQDHSDSTVSFCNLKVKEL